MAEQNQSGQSSGEAGAVAPAGSEASSAGQSTDSFGAMAPELGPNGLPIQPTGNDQGDGVDADFLMNTFFGDGQAPAPENKNGAGGQAQGSNPAPGQDDQGSLAPPQPAPAANGGDGSPQPGPAPTQQNGQQQAGPGAPAPQTPAPGSPPAAAAEPAGQGLSAEDRLRLASAGALAQQNAELLERLRRYESGQPPQQQPGQQPPAQQGQGQPPAPQSGAPEEQVRLTVPDALFDAVMSEDRATAMNALSALITGVAQNAVRVAHQAAGQLVDQRLQGFQQTVEQRQALETMESKYFEAFPAHNNPMFRQLIQQVTEEKYRAFPNAPWEADMINAVGATVNEKLKALGIDPAGIQIAGAGGQAPQGQGNGQPQGQQPPARQQPAPMLDTTNRGGNGQGGVPADAGDFIASTFR